MNEERLTEIEIKLAYQEKIINDLNDVVCDQQKEIEKLGSICEKLIKIVNENGLTVPTIDAPADEKPPHY
ncbi:MAG: SlyX protein [Bdellovibrionales bacterium RIFOXYB2_FULL_36_6]|jgi:SlyX protein|nr:MAG: SlyX protein [Bdellovibrionales bacterium RIFOXYB2_FULL_36_6]OGR12796.1 MAG: SlyX protein [Desulfobacula sp. GWF2_41_7]OGR23483.1 MAG: SlyX protein [Desulfobacterales bacterium RIFOXYA12_FULL_46_15]